MSETWKPKKKFSDPTRLSRKVFDAHVDRVEAKRQRDRDDHRADMQALLSRIENLETQLMELADDLNTLAMGAQSPVDSRAFKKHGNEELG